MKTFGLIAEGATDHAVIESILLGFFADQDEEPLINRLQPPRDETGAPKEGTFGGWNELFEYFKRGDHRQALQFNSYLIVHVDTDVSEQKGFDVPHREGGKELSPEELIPRVIARLTQAMGQEFYEQHKERFLFAVAVHQVECWLLPLLTNEAKKQGKTKGCLDAANDALRKRNEKALDKQPRRYQDASRGYRKRKALLACAPLNPSLKIFIEALEARNIALADE